jgi:serine protease Do
MLDKTHKIITTFIFACLVFPVVPSLHAQNPSRLSPPPEKRIMTIAKKALPAVVHLEITPGNKPTNPLSPPPYYPIFITPDRLSRLLKNLTPSRLGTGILIDPQGHILTNAFLVREARAIRCYLYKGKWYDAKLVGSDTKTNLAVLKISGTRPFPHVSSGNPDGAPSGQWVIALGHYTARKPTISAGIISAEHHNTSSELKNYQNFLQTDTGIDLLNTGGPLINIHGKALGINDALLTRISNLPGIGFATPWTFAMHVAEQLISNRKVTHGWLGLRVQNVILRSKRGKEGFIKGVMVVDVINNSPAFKAGVKPGDIIASYRETPIKNVSQLQHLVSLTPVGKTVELGIARRRSTKMIPITVETRKNYLPPSKIITQLGISFIPCPGNMTGLVLSRVDPAGPMGRAGFEPEDIILEVNGKPVKNENDLKKILKPFKPGDYILFHAIDHRTGRKGYVQIHLQ